MREMAQAVIGEPPSLTQPLAFSRATIVVVDDEPANVELVEDLLAQVGYERVVGITDSARVIEVVESLRPDLVVLDLHIREPDGLTLIRTLRASRAGVADVPILVLTADARSHTRREALRLGASDFATKPLDVVELMLRVRHLVEIRFLNRLHRNQNEALEQAVRERTEELEHSRLELLSRLALLAEYRDDQTAQHTLRVGRAAALLADSLGCEEANIDLISRAAPLHDIGKIGIPDAILLKPGRLTATEFQTMTKHVVIGVRILSGSESPLLRMATEIALHHHERWDGDGYRHGLRGEQIPLTARIVAVADVFDALVHERPYKPRMPVEQATEVIAHGSGKHFDPAVVEAFSGLDPYALVAPVEGGGL